MRVVREAWKVRWTGASLTAGLLADGGDQSVVSEMNESGVVFGDGIEDDALHFG